MNRIFKYALMFAFVGIAMFALSQMSDGADAADVVWDGGGTDNLASTGANWVGDAVPASGDNKIFDATSSKTCDYNLVGNGIVSLAWNFNGIVNIITPTSCYLAVNGGTCNINVNATFSNIQFDGGIVNINSNFRTGEAYFGWSNYGSTYGNDYLIITSGRFGVYNDDIVLENINVLMTGTGDLATRHIVLNSLTINSSGTITQVEDVNIAYTGFNFIAGSLTYNGAYEFNIATTNPDPPTEYLDDTVWLGIIFMSIATIINFVGYVRKIGLLQIVSFLVLLVGIFAATDVWEELWTLPTLFVLTNAVIFIIGMIRRG